MATTILHQRPACLRGLQSATKSFSTPAYTCALFSTSVRPAKQARLSTDLSRPTTSILSTRKCAPTSSVGIRHASSPSQAASSANTTSEDVLTWDRFFDLRRKRRWINLGCSVLTAVGAVGVFAPLLAQQDFDSWGAQISGLDPVIVLGISTFAIAAGGWLCGPSFGTAMFSIWAARRGWNRLIVEKEKSFFARIKRYRADPSASSPQNPIPDYYGEKIASVKDYRRWLKDQKAFNLKKNKNML